ncbi:MAG TPA: hypothetical protein VGP26_25080 [Actinophytocola sp.]|nr:hypothetical protein [Actinophytocola sp.]
MREPIDVSPEVFDAASKIFGADMFSVLRKACTGLESGLSGCGAMAGSDPAGTTWAASYDEAAGTVHSIIGDLGTASVTLAAMLQQTGFNHGMAESASDPSRSAPTPADRSTYVPTPASLPNLPSAHGGSSGPPGLWWLVEHTVGYVWPDGDPGKLRTARDAWSAAADSLAAADVYVSEGLEAIVTQQSPEMSDAFAVCEGMGSHIDDVSAACRELSRACGDFAEGIDTAHKDVEDELVSLAEWTAGIEAGGLLLGLVTFGGAEGAAQGVEAARIATTAARVGKIIQTVIDLAGTVARTIGSVLTKIAEAGTRLKVILGARLSKAVTALTSRLPGAATDATDVAFNGLSAWAKNWSTRGLEIEAELGGNLPRSFPTIDKFENGVATSIKSVDLAAPTYQNAGALTSKLEGYVDKAAGFNGASWDGTVIRARDVTTRALEVAIQPGVASPTQLAVLDQLRQYASSKGVQLIISEVP